MADPSVNPLNVPGTLGTSLPSDVMEAEPADGRHDRDERRDTRSAYRDERQAQRAHARAVRYEARSRRRAERPDRQPDLVPLLNFCKNIVDDASDFLAEVAQRMEARNKERQQAADDDGGGSADSPKGRGSRRGAPAGAA